MKRLLSEVYRFQKIAGLNENSYSYLISNFKKFGIRDNAPVHLVWSEDGRVTSYDSGGLGSGGSGYTPWQFLEMIRYWIDNFNYKLKFKSAGKKDLDGYGAKRSLTPKMFIEVYKPKDKGKISLEILVYQGKSDFKPHGIKGLDEEDSLRREMELGLKPDQLEEDDYDMGTPSGDTDVMNIAEEGNGENDIDLSNTPEFKKEPDIFDEDFRSFVWHHEGVGAHYKELYGTIDLDDVDDIIGQYLQALPYDEVEAFWSDYIEDKRAGLKENDIDLSDTPKFETSEFKKIFTPLLRREGIQDDRDYNLILHDQMENNLLKKVKGKDIPDFYEKVVQDYDWDSIQYLQDTIDFLGIQEDFPEGCLEPSPSGGIVSLLVSDDTVLDIVEASLKEDGIDLSDTPKFTDEKKQFYVYDIEGMEPPLGPYSLEHARRVLRGLSASGEEYGMVNGEVAREIWDLEEDIDLSDTPEFSSLPSEDDVINDPSFTPFMDNAGWEYDRFGFAEIRGRVYYIPDLEQDEGDREVIPLRKGISLSQLISTGKEKGYFSEDEYGIYFDTELEREIDRWISSLT